MFSAQFGGQIAWLLPAAVLALVVLLWVTRRRPRQDRLRASLVLWGGWLLVSAAVFSFMAGTIHPYYTIVMAPAIAALVAIGGREGWRHRRHPAARALLAAAFLGTGVWSAVLLRRTPTFVPWLAWLVLAAAMVVAVVIMVPGARVRVAFPAARVRRAGLAGAVMCAVLAVLGGPAAYAVETVAVSHPGSQASAGPAVPRGIGGAARGQRRGAGFDADGTPGAGGPGAGGPGAGGPGAGGPGAGGPGAGGPGAGGPGAGGPGGWGGRGAADPAVAALLRTAGTTWSAATATTMAAAGMELASGTSVMGIGGFSGSDPTPTLDQFQAYVTAGKIHYFVESGPRSDGRGGNRPGAGRGGRGARGAAIPIQDWVHAHYMGTPVGAQTVYDLTAPPH
jgi:4-amino-4-deoxy-L-arabinose transferase-like glycosyltransferase